MRDLVVREALENLAADAAFSLGRLVSEGHEVPFEVEEQPGEGAALYHYTPLIDRFLREHAQVLRGLDNYGVARAAVEAAGFAEDYLRYVGGVVPSDPEARAGEAIFVYLCRLWRDCPTFELDDERVEVALQELERSYDGRADTVEVVAPMLGLTMPLERLALGEVVLVDAGSVDVPPEVTRADGLGIGDWSMPVLGIVRVAVHGESAPALIGIERLRGAITALRLLREGSVGIGSHAWTRAGDGQWRRVTTGCGPVRPGGYVLGEEECEELGLFVDSLRARPIRAGELSFAIRRFETGLERTSPVEALSDYLLAMRSLLEGGGPAELGLALRVAALCAEPAERAGVKNAIDDAFALEREVMICDGELADPDAASLLVHDVEELLRAILRDAVSGHLGSDLRATADEILLADGMKTSSTPSTSPSTEVGEIDPHIEGETRPPVGEGDEERTSSPERVPEDGREPHLLRVPRPPADDRNTPPGAGEDWFGEEDPAESLEWPALTQREPRERKRGSGSRPQPGHASNVRNLFPEPETTEWSVGAPLQVRREDTVDEWSTTDVPDSDEAEQYEPAPMPGSVQTTLEDAEEPEDDDEDYWSAPA